MTSSPKERVWLVYSAYKIAYDRRKHDWKNAETVKQVEMIDRNLDRLELTYRRTIRGEMDKTGEDVEAAFKAAKQSLKEVKKAYDQAKKVTERIRAVTNLVGSIDALVRKAL